MINHHSLWVLFILIHEYYCQTTDKYTDENRPYKFGFNIEGYQHRREEKDEKGIIMGEFGFITADGYYRVTVYATDENGDFKILSMKNYYVGFPPEDPSSTPSIPMKMPILKTTDQVVFDPIKTTANPFKAYNEPTGLPGCSNCWIPTTQKLPVGTKNNKGGLTNKLRPSGDRIRQKPKSRTNMEPKIPLFTENPFEQTLTNTKNSFSRSHLSSTSSTRSPIDVTSSSARSKLVENLKPANKTLKPGNISRQKANLEDRSNRFEYATSRSRTQNPTGNNQLPPGLTIQDVKDLLYKFNYTVGFHGHLERGYRNGDKNGGFFFDGRDGTERRVKYLANEFGYQPNITLIELPKNDRRIPQELTEKKYGLEGYEFKWFYRK